MTRFSHFIKTSVIGGLLVISPITILYIAFRWAFLSLSEFIEPLTTPITDRSSAPDLAVDALVIALLLFGCCVVGTAVTTGAGKWLHRRFDRTLATLAPGYNLVKDILHQFFGDGDGAALRSTGPRSPGSNCLASTWRLLSPPLSLAAIAIMTIRCLSPPAPIQLRV